MKKLIISFLALFVGLLLVTQISPLATVSASTQHAVSPAAKVKTPVKVKQFTATATGEATVKVTWKKHQADGTQVRVVNQRGELVTKKNTKKRQGITITGLTPGTIYKLKARAYNKRGDGGFKYGEYSKTKTVTTSEAAAEDQQDEASKTVDVAISGFAFSPETITVNVGDSVRWTNNDSVTHTASEVNLVFNTDPLSPGESATLLMDQAGSFDYFCVFHHSMTGLVIVE